MTLNKLVKPSPKPGTVSAPAPPPPPVKKESPDERYATEMLAAYYR
ncbi:MAG: hypothetical protein M5U01_10740 [Ardenticatenaceae bacterium]|nr:hypothetical protein [Ardenticatenaceae bacterium]